MPSIRQISPSITTFTVPFERGGIIKFGGRATSVKLQNGKLAVFSPVSLSDEVKAEVQRQGGEVGYIVAPDIEHHLHLTAWKAAFPRAQIIAPDGLREKRATSNPKGDIPFDFIISRSTTAAELPEDFAKEFLVEFFDAHANKEIAFLYQPEKTLIQADLVFNTPAYEAYGEAANTGIATKLFNKFVGSTAGAAKGQQRFLWWAVAKDRASFARSAKVVNAWDFERIIPCHGDVIESGGKGTYQKLFGWYLDYKQ